MATIFSPTAFLPQLHESHEEGWPAALECLQKLAVLTLPGEPWTDEAGACGCTLLLSSLKMLQRHIPNSSSEHYQKGWTPVFRDSNQLNTNQPKPALDWLPLSPFLSSLTLKSCGPHPSPSFPLCKFFRPCTHFHSIEWSKINYIHKSSCLRFYSLGGIASYIRPRSKNFTFLASQ